MSVITCTYTSVESLVLAISATTSDPVTSVPFGLQRREKELARGSITSGTHSDQSHIMRDLSLCNDVTYTLQYRWEIK